MCVEHSGTVTGPVHPVRTEPDGYCYFFHDKHHTPANTGDAQWRPDLSEADEFQIFSDAARHRVEVGGDLFGVRVLETGEVDVIGTRSERVAKFEKPNSGVPWHGFPYYPIVRNERDRPRKYPVPRKAILKMREAGLITRTQCQRLEKGKRR